MGYKPEREIRSVLHDRSEVVFDTGERIVFVAARPGGIPLAVDPDSIVDDLIISLEQKDKEIAKLKELSIRWERAFDKADKQYLKLEKANAALRRQNESSGRFVIQDRKSGLYLKHDGSRQDHPYDDVQNVEDAEAWKTLEHAAHALWWYVDMIGDYWIINLDTGERCVKDIKRGIAHVKTEVIAE